MKLNSQVFLPGADHAGEKRRDRLPESGPEIFRRIRSADKELYAPEVGGHNLVLADEYAYIAFAKAVRFLDRY